MYNTNMKIIRLDKADSTHSYLKEYIIENGFENLTCIWTDEQTSGVGSRGNSWSGVKGNLFFSFAVSKESLPSDLPIQSASIYFSFILKTILKKMGSKLWLKWPNDFYIGDKKVGGTITTFSKNIAMCGIGINLTKVSDEYATLDIPVDINNLLNDYLRNIEKNLVWRDIFRQYVIEFQLSKKFQATINGKKVSLEHAILNDDGSIEINKEKVFSLR